MSCLGISEAGAQIVSDHHAGAIRETLGIESWPWWQVEPRYDEGSEPVVQNTTGAFVLEGWSGANSRYCGNRSRIRAAAALPYELARSPDAPNARPRPIS